MNWKKFHCVLCIVFSLTGLVLLVGGELAAAAVLLVFGGLQAIHADLEDIKERLPKKGEAK